ncbi:MAG: hypothetical protein J7493_03535 [Porphyrobacter sp.]|nr:hypothetical protein [Porphyrobacter sp.]
MRKLIAFLAAAALCAGGLAAPAAAQRGDRGHGNHGDSSRSDQATAREEMNAGRNLSSRDIERRIVPQMRGSDYLGFEYDSVASAYRLKFIKEGQVTWVDVDARTGRVLRVSK